MWHMPSLMQPAWECRLSLCCLSVSRSMALWMWYSQPLHQAWSPVRLSPGKSSKCLPIASVLLSIIKWYIIPPMWCLFACCLLAFCWKDCLCVICNVLIWSWMDRVTSFWWLHYLFTCCTWLLKMYNSGFAYSTTYPCLWINSKYFTLILEQNIISSLIINFLNLVLRHLVITHIKLVEYA